MPGVLAYAKWGPVGRMSGLFLSMPAFREDRSAVSGGLEEHATSVSSFHYSCPWEKPPPCYHNALDSDSSESGSIRGTAFAA